MWPDDEDLTAPAIVISSLGGLVHRKHGLTTKDEYRAHILRQALKAQLGRPRIHSRARNYACPIEPHQAISSGVIQHRVLPTEDGSCRSHDTKEGSLCKSSNPRGFVNSEASMSQRKRSWKVHSLLAGEWRDRLGRHRRAHPSGYPMAAVASIDRSVLSSVPGSSSCGGTEVSFEGLVQELRERLPQASPLMELVTAQQVEDNNCAIAEVMARGKRNAEQGNLRRNDGPRDVEGPLGCEITDGCCLEGGAAGGGRFSTPPGTLRGCSTEQRDFPPGCLQLRSLTGPLGVFPQQLARSELGSIPRRDVGLQPSLLLPRGAISHGGAYGSITTAAKAMAEGASPSATMVAAAKASERALPLLQVCATKVPEPTRVRQA